MKRSRFVTVLVLSAMLLGVVQPAFAWGTRTGSRLGDAAVYGAGGGILAIIGVGALCIFCPPAGVTVGTALTVGGGVGAVGGATYGALKEEKTLASDMTAGAVIMAASPAIIGGAAYAGGAEAVKKVGKVALWAAGAAGVGFYNKTGEASAEDLLK